MSSVMRFDEWQDSDGNPVFNGAGGVSPGGLIAVKSAIFTGTQVESSVSPGGVGVAVTDLSITHEVADPANRLIISAFFGAVGTAEGHGNAGIAVHDGTGLIAVGASPGSRNTVTAGGFTQHPATSTLIVSKPSVTFVHTPGAGSKTYTVRAVVIAGSPGSVFINRGQLDNDGSGRTRAVSSLVIQEVAV